MALICALFESIWRRGFGCSGWHIKILENRFVEHIIGFLGIFLCLLVKYNVWQALIVSGVMQGLYWAPAVGMYQDIGSSGEPDEEMKKRYDSIWYNKFLDKWFKNYKYTAIYDWVGLMIRYTLPAIIISIILFNGVFCFAGFCVSSVYTFMVLLKKDGYINSHLAYSELLSGFITGFLLLS